MKSAIVIGILMLSASAQEVQHAPTVAQCQADQRLWLSELEDTTSLAIRRVDTNQLDNWAIEMRNCVQVDPYHQYGYYNTAAESTSLISNRFFNFLLRHNLYFQFVAEDREAASK